MKLKKQCKNDTERTALTWENNVQRIRKRNRFLKNNLKDKKSKFGVVRKRHKLNRKSGGRQQLNEKRL